MKLKILFITSVFILLFIAASTENKRPFKEQLREWDPDFSFVRETLYTLKPNWFEIDLSTQSGKLHTKDSTFLFQLSSGNPRLLKSIATKEGVFVLQSMLPKLHSVQFDSTLMLNWMGFSWGIGFHALLGSGYYGYLGKRPSSHGCVRISRESAKVLYEEVSIGTPVLVHSGSSAVTISFGDSTKKYKYLNYSLLKREVVKRVNLLYQGESDWNRPRLLIDRANVFNDGLISGDAALISPKQSYSYWAALHTITRDDDLVAEANSNTRKYPPIQIK